MVGAAVVGGGTPAFGAGPVPPLRLADTRCHDGSDNVLLRYQANRQFAGGCAIIMRWQLGRGVRWVVLSGGCDD